MSCRWLSFILLSLCTCLQAEQNFHCVGTYRVFQFENEHVRVWKTVIMPHQSLKMHRHDCSRVLVALKGGKLTKMEDTGESSELFLEEDKAYWLDQDALHTLHADINESEEPIEIMVIEVKA
ncbi:MAG: hypothetical protein JSS62_06740 [Verrucomicrobia bacterium]|nr:hypothetical protein [Verrucomicrobiota bacterium]MBS0645897.1 hypothetical protein [Verrucomicrobiota bacterium]